LIFGHPRSPGWPQGRQGQRVRLDDPLVREFSDYFKTSS
jgi:hypothetical protein